MPKSPEMASFLDRLVNRSDALNRQVCVNPPIGCGGPAREFRDALSEKEYGISGLCQKCQDKVFG